jgi:predicted butyrate kinase (DUF1464 family)
LNSASGAEAFADGTVAGGFLGLLLGSKKMRKMGGSVLGYVALPCWERWRSVPIRTTKRQGCK